MQVLKAKQEQFNEVDGYTNGNNALEFTQDANGNHIVGRNVLICEAFAEIRTQLEQLEEIEHNPKVEDVEI